MKSCVCFIALTILSGKPYVLFFLIAAGQSEMFRKWRTLGQSYFERCHVMSKCFWRCTEGWKTTNVSHYHCSGSLSVSQTLHMPINVRERWVKVIFLKKAFCRFYTFLDNWHHLSVTLYFQTYCQTWKMFSPTWDDHFEPLLLRKQKSQITIQFHFRIMSKPINMIILFPETWNNSLIVYGWHKHQNDFIPLRMTINYTFCGLLMRFIFVQARIIITVTNSHFFSPPEY